MSACVVPVAPDFQDPPASKNYAPFFLNVQPDYGAIVTQPSFLVTVSDPNVGDDLYVRWIVDYPPYGDDTRTFEPDKVSHSADGTPLFKDLPFTPDCVVYNLAKIPSHQIEVVVADRPFSAQVPSQQIDLTRIPSDGGKVIASWTLDMECK